MKLRTLALSAVTASLSPLLHAEVATKPIAKGFERPVWAGVPEGTAGKLWVMEQAGRVHILDVATGEWKGKPFLDISDLVTRKGNEEGLLGLAFAKDFATSGRFYVNYTDKEKQTKIVRYTSKDKLTTDPATAEELLVYPSEFENHNGGWIGFGPDGYLYIANGDGGSGNDPKQRAQDLNNLLGKILRIDVSPEKGYKVPADNPFVGQADHKPEIWSYGVRNPWRNSFDRETGDFWIADVGQGLWEEVNFIPNGKSKGVNFGWRLREGLIATPTKDVGGELAGAYEPIYVYKHGKADNEGLSITGGYVYRGSAVPELKGRYVFADYQNPRIWSFKAEDGKAADFKDHTKTLQPEGGRINLISAFAEDNKGELFILDHTGGIYQIVEK
jgi:glucose/arabinose dehydrogenase